MGISQDPAGLQEGLGEYGNFTRRGVEDAAPYKTCAFDDSTRKFATAIGAQGAPLQTQSVCTILTVLCANCKQLPRRPVGLPAMTNLRALHFPLSHDPVFFQEEL